MPNWREFREFGFSTTATIRSALLVEGPAFRRIAEIEAVPSRELYFLRIVEGSDPLGHHDSMTSYCISLVIQMGVET